MTALDAEAKAHSSLKQKYTDRELQAERMAQRELHLQQRVTDLETECAAVRRDAEDRELEQHLCERELHRSQAEAAELRAALAELNGNLDVAEAQSDRTASALRRGSTFAMHAREWHCRAVESLSVGVQVDDSSWAALPRNSKGSVKKLRSATQSITGKEVLKTCVESSLVYPAEADLLLRLEAEPVDIQ